VDLDYYRQTKRLDVREETKINASKEEADEYYAAGMEVDGKPNFISDLFFLLNSIHHIGLSKTLGTRKDLDKGVSELEEDLRNFEARRGEWTAVSVHSDSMATLLTCRRTRPHRLKAKLTLRS
jgi:ubiquitin conjugation factor E4 B